MLKKRETFDYSVKSGTYGFTIADVDTERRTIMAVGNTYNYMDTMLDVLQHGAAKRSVQLMGPESNDSPKIKHALNHDLTTLPGKITKLEEKLVNIKGENMMCLCFESRLSDTILGNDTLINYQEGIYDQHSIGFKYVDVKAFNPLAHGNSEEGKEWNEFKKTIANADEYEELMQDCWDTRVLKVNEIKLFEISTVAFGANSLTPYLGSKTMNPETFVTNLKTRIKKMHSCVKNGVQSDETLRIIDLQAKQLEAILDEIFNRNSIGEYLAKEFGKPVKQQEGITARDLML